MTAFFFKFFSEIFEHTQKLDNEPIIQIQYLKIFATFAFFYLYWSIWKEIQDIDVILYCTLQYKILKIMDIFIYNHSGINTLNKVVDNSLVSPDFF